MKLKANGTEVVLKIKISSMNKRLFNYITSGGNGQYTTDTPGLTDLYYIEGLGDMIHDDVDAGNLPPEMKEAHEDLCDFMKCFGATYAEFVK